MLGSRNPGLASVVFETEDLRNGNGLGSIKFNNNETQPVGRIRCWLIRGGC